jgi:hypothetical protein
VRGHPCITIGRRIIYVQCLISFPLYQNAP